MWRFSRVCINYVWFHQSIIGSFHWLWGLHRHATYKLHCKGTLRRRCLVLLLCMDQRCWGNMCVLWGTLIITLQCSELQVGLFSCKMQSHWTTTCNFLVKKNVLIRHHLVKITSGWCDIMQEHFSSVRYLRYVYGLIIKTYTTYLQAEGYLVYLLGCNILCVPLYL